MQLGYTGNWALLSLAKGLEMALVGEELQKVEALGDWGLPDGLILLMNLATAVRPGISSLRMGAQYHGSFFLLWDSATLSSSSLQSKHYKGDVIRSG